MLAGAMCAKGPQGGADTLEGMTIAANIANTIALYGLGAAEALAETVWPTRCAVCDAPGEPLCEHCRTALRYVDWWRACPRCGAPFGRLQCCECNEVMLAAIGRRRPAFDGMTAAVTYDDAAARIVRSWKDGGERRLARETACLMAPQVPPGWLTDAPVCVPIPASGAAKRRRGFDHVDELSREVACALGLRRVGLLAPPRTLDQRTLGRKGRIGNLSGRFRVIEGATVPPHVLLVDDVCTTGSTMSAACDALRAAGAQTLHCLMFARV
ncbi:ComF family protein [Senegalimassilia faecalis]|uniref:ComF family protein n=1 Tax=Senegalimassilia faecalis TaxID=2509433 RepID=UPI003A96E4DC